MIKKASIKIFSKENFLIFSVFFLSTLFFIYQHSSGLSWDFSVYVLNAKHFFSNKGYFEWLRPPLAPFLLGVFSVFGWNISEYIFIIFTSCLFLFSSIKLCEKLNIPKEIYYLCSMSFYTLTFSFSAGTELLSLSLLQLTAAYIKEWSSGLFLTLAFLTRYNNIIYFPLLFIYKDWKRILIAISVGAILLSPWLLYNFLKSGDPFLSFTDFYFMNIKFRGDLRENVELKNFLIVGNFFTPLILLGAINFFKSKNKVSWLIVLFIILSLLSYFLGAFKDKRYLFNLVMPFSYLCCFAFERKFDFVQISLFFLSFIAAIAYFVPFDSPEIYKELAMKLDKCETRSNGWVYLNYFGFESGPIPWKHQIENMTNEGVRFLVFRGIKDPDFGSFWDKLPKIEDGKEYFIVGNNSICKPPKSFSKSYFDLVAEACGIDIGRYESLFFDDKLCSSIKYCDEFKSHICH